jgi:putative ABC transport system permease protein
MSFYNLSAALRFIRRNLAFTLINISGLSLGLVLVVFLMLWMKFEFSFDRFHQNAEKIFRVVTEIHYENSQFSFTGTPAPLGETLKNNIPEVKDFVRFGSLGRTLVTNGNKQFYEEIKLTDPSVFRIFTFPLLSGSADLALNDPAAIIISESKARKYFGSEDPIGKTLLLGHRMSPYIVSGIMKDVPANSQLQFDFLCSFSKLERNISWGHWNYITYILATDKGSVPSISKKLPGLIKDIPGKDNYMLHIQPLTDIHLYSRLQGDFPNNMNINTIYIIGSIFILVLIVACINYMNLATARYTKRGKEASLRKVTGATSSDLIQQFIFESFAVTFSAFIIAFLLCFILMPVFSSITGVAADGSLFYFRSFINFLLLIIIISITAGSYPALLLSSANPVSALRNDINLGKILSVNSLRKGLIIFQFFVTISLIATTLIIRSQMEFIRNKNLGLSPDQVVVVSMSNSEVSKKYELYKNEVLKYPSVQNVTAVSYFPGEQGSNQNVWWEGLQEGDDSNVMSWLSADQDFIKTLKLELVSGADFPENLVHDSLSLYILNEAALKKTGWHTGVDKQFEIVGLKKRGKVTGVVRDFNFKSLHNSIEPVVIVCYPLLFDNLMIKISAQDIPATISLLQEKWKGIYPQMPFEYSFLNDDFQKMYDKENRTLKMITWISVMSLFISCVGLFGLVLFTLDCRVKEIGLRKAAGSTSARIVLMLNLEFIRWIIVSFIISCPIVVFIMHKWLKTFAFRITLQWWMFAAAGILTVLMSLLTVSWHTLKVASTNPADCLKHE